MINTMSTQISTSFEYISIAWHIPGQSNTNANVAFNCFAMLPVQLLNLQWQVDPKNTCLRRLFQRHTYVFSPYSSSLFLNMYYSQQKYQLSSDWDFHYSLLIYKKLSFRFYSLQPHSYSIDVTICCILFITYI